MEIVEMKMGENTKLRSKVAFFYYYNPTFHRARIFSARSARLCLWATIFLIIR